MDPASSDPIKPLSDYTPQTDSSKFIRTYAKDFAALSGQAAVMATPTPLPQQRIAPENTTVTEAGVSLTDYDPSPVNRRDSSSPKEFEQEVVDLKESDSEGIFGGIMRTPSAPQPASYAPLMPQGTVTPLPNVESSYISEPVPAVSTPAPPPAPEPVSIPTPAPAESEADREAILARLRAKVAAERAVTATAPAVTSELPLRTAAPDFASIPEPVLPIPQPSKEPVAPPVPIPVPEVSSPLHTYSSDFADRIDSASGSTFSVLAAQSDAGQTQRSPEPRKRTFVPLFAGAAMLVIGIGAVAGAYFFTRQGGIPMAASVPSLITFDESVEVKGTGQDLMQAIAKVAEGGTVQGNVIVTYVTLATTTGTGIPQPGSVLIRDMNLSAPDILLRNIDTTSTVGVIKAGSESRPFMLLKVNSYERTFAGMLAWEPTMATDLAVFYPPYAITPVDASSTPAAFAPQPTTFSDAVVANYDVRVLRDSSGKSLMLYGYRGKDTLIIARDEAAFTALVSRLSASGK